MLDNVIEFTAKNKLLPTGYTSGDTEIICPFTLEPVAGCRTRNASDDEELCSYTLEVCSHRKRGRLQ